jgi:hypothetical protein
VAIARWQRAVHVGDTARGKPSASKAEVSGVVTEESDRFVWVGVGGKAACIPRQNLKR